MTIREKVENYILELTSLPELDHSMNLFENNILTSLDVLDLISFIEETFNVSPSDEDIGIESLGSINSIVNLIEKLKQNV